MLIISICNVGYSADNEKWVKYPDVFGGFAHPKVAINVLNGELKFVITKFKSLESDSESNIDMFGFDGQELKQEPFKISPASLYESQEPEDDNLGIRWLPIYEYEA